MLSNVLSVSIGNKIHICIDGVIVYTHTAPGDKATILIQNGSINYNINSVKAESDYGIEVIDASEVPMTPNVTHHVKKVY